MNRQWVIDNKLQYHPFISTHSPFVQPTFPAIAFPLVDILQVILPEIVFRQAQINSGSGALDLQSQGPLSP